MSTLKADAITAITTDGNLALTGDGTGKVDIGDGALTFPDADGTANQIIETDGSGVLSFVAKPGGGLVSLQNSAPSVTANHDFTGFVAATYDSYKVLITNVAPGTDNKDFECETSTDGGSTYDTGAADYQWAMNYHIGVSDSFVTDQSDDSMHFVTSNGVGSADNETLSGEVIIYFPGNASEETRFTFWGSNSHDNAGEIAVNMTSAARMSAADVDAIRFHWDAGNFQAVGKIQYLGITK